MARNAILAFIAAVFVVGCQTREAQIDTFLLVVPSDSAESAQYSAEIYRSFSQQFDIDVLERVEIRMHSTSKSNQVTELVFDEFLSLENREKLLQSKLSSLIRHSSDTAMTSAATSDLLRSLSEMYSKGSESEEVLVALVGRFPVCYADTSMLAYLKKLKPAEEKPTLQWIVPGTRDSDQEILKQLGGVFEVVAHPMMVRDYPNCAERADATDASAPSPPVVVVSFISDTTELARAGTMVAATAKGGVVLVVREGVDSVIRVASGGSQDLTLAALKRALEPTVKPRWNSVNYLLKRGFASAARLGTIGVNNPVMVILGNMPDQTDAEIRKLPVKGALLDSTDFNSLPEETAFAFIPTRGKEGRTMRALRIALSKRRLKVVSDGEVQ